MATTSQSASFSQMLLSAVLTIVLVGLSYWIWQDVAAILRPLRGEGWQLLKNMSFVMPVLAIFLFLSLANFVFDKAGGASWVKWILISLLLLGVFLALVRYGSFYGKEIEPYLQPLGIERPAILKK